MRQALFLRPDESGHSHGSQGTGIIEWRSFVRSGCAQAIEQGQVVFRCRHGVGCVFVVFVVDDVVDVNPGPGTTLRNVPFITYDGNKGKFSSIGHQYDNGTWVSAAEAVKLSIENNSKTGDSQAETNAFYIMGGRRFGDFLAHVTYAQLDEDEGRQSSWTLGLNYNILPTVVLKGEYKRVDTTGGYDGVFVRNAQELYDNTVYDRTNGLAGVPARNYDGDIISAGVDFVF
mgnify:CR=1 FL=1